GGLTAQNNAQLVLNGTNSYTGTTVAGGTTANGFGRVYINGSNTGTGAVTTSGGGTAGAGGTIGGAGAVAGAVTISTTTASTPGANGPDYQAASFGSITLPTGFTGTPVTLNNGVSATDITPLFAFTGTYNTNTTPVVAYTGTGGSGTLMVQFTPVPEPAFVLLACGAAGGLGWWRKRQTRA